MDLRLYPDVENGNNRPYTNHMKQALAVFLLIALTQAHRYPYRRPTLTTGNRQTKTVKAAYPSASPAATPSASPVTAGCKDVKCDPAPKVMHCAGRGCRVPAPAQPVSQPCHPVYGCAMGSSQGVEQQANQQPMGQEQASQQQPANQEQGNQQPDNQQQTPPQAQADQPATQTDQQPTPTQEQDKKAVQDKGKNSSSRLAVAIWSILALVCSL